MSFFYFISIYIFFTKLVKIVLKIVNVWYNKIVYNKGGDKMKEATGEMNMTVVTIIAIGAIIAFFWIMWPNIQDAISGQWGKTNCPSGQTLVDGQCQ